MDKLSTLRKRIDACDRELLRLLNERMGLAAEVGELKRASGLPVTDTAREREVVQRLKKMNAGPLGDEGLEAVYREIFSAAKAIEKQSAVAYLGPEATFSHLAALKHFGRSQAMLPCRSIREVFRAVEKNEADLGVVPVENSTEGVVNHTLDLLVDTPLPVTDEIYLEVHHHLLSREEDLARVHTIYSHPQAISQCQEWLQEKAGGVTLTEVASTAEAAALALRTEGAAAIASEIAARLYHLPVLARRIEDRFDNLTRFLVIGGPEPAPSGHDKTSTVFSIRDRVGALHDILAPMSAAGLSLTRIESRPSRRRAWDYVFFVDFHGHRRDPLVARVIEQLRAQCPFFKILGSYPDRHREPGDKH